MYLIVYEICLNQKSGNRIMRIFPTIQKPYRCVYSILAMAGASDAMKPERFSGGQNFRRWQTKVKFWLMSLGLWWVIHQVMPFTVEQANTFQSTSDSALGCILTLLADNLYDLYMEYTNHT